MDDSDLLYEDLFENLDDGKSIIKTSLHEMEDQIKYLSNEAEDLRLQVRNLQDQNEELSKQNEVLIRNISCLFKTAQMEISRKDKQIRSLQEESLKASTAGHGVPASTASTQDASGREKPHPALRNDSKCRTGETALTSGSVGKQGHHGDKPSEFAAMASQVDCKPSRMRDSPLAMGSKYMGKRVHHGDELGEHVVLASQADCKGRIGKTPLSPSGTGKRGFHELEYGECIEKNSGSRKGSERHSEIWKKRRGKEEDATVGDEHHRKRGHWQHHLTARKGEGAINAHRASGTHRASESRRESWIRS